jgi:hypothetical protein
MLPFKLDKKWYLSSFERNFTLSEYVDQKQKDGTHKRILVPRSYFDKIETAISHWAYQNVKDSPADLLTALSDVSRRLTEIKECLKTILT